jgi:hypothetical protein
VQRVTAQLASLTHGTQREGLLELARILADVEDARGAEALLAVEQARLLPRLVELAFSYIDLARGSVSDAGQSPADGEMDCLLVLCALTNVAFFGGTRLISQANGLEVSARLTPLERSRLSLRGVLPRASDRPRAPPARGSSRA